MKRMNLKTNRIFLIIAVLIFTLTSGCISFPGIRPNKFLAQEEIEVGKLKWYEVEGMACRDGSPTGVGVKIKNPKKLAIYLNGGGACFNKPTCNSNPSSFNEADMFELFNSAQNGIFDDGNLNNPIRDWSVLFIPYCTGDVHMGTKWQGRALDVSKPQAFVGAYNFEKAIIFIQSYFKKQGVEEILIFGISAGGYGVYTNFLKLKQYFSNVKITLINDSGPLINDMQVFSPIFQLGAVGIYGIIPPPGFFNPDFFNYGFTPSMHSYLSKRFPKDNFALISSLEDNVIRYFLGFTYANAEDGRVPAEDFKQALLNLRNEYLIPDTRWSTFYTKGDTHGQVQENDRFYENSTADGTTLNEFVARVLSGEQNLHLTVE
jgi:hypothetical protein